MSDHYATPTLPSGQRCRRSLPHDHLAQSNPRRDEQPAHPHSHQPLQAFSLRFSDTLGVMLYMMGVGHRFIRKIAVWMREAR